MTFELREHTADVAVAAEGATLGAAFAAVADGMAAAQSDDIPATGGERREIAVAAENREALLFDYLDELIYERDIRSVLPFDNEATVHPPGEGGSGEGGLGEGGPGEGGQADGDDATWRIEASYRGVPLADVVARDLKAVTYSDMRIEETGAGWEAYVVFDV